LRSKIEKGGGGGNTVNKSPVGCILRGRKLLRPLYLRGKSINFHIIGSLFPRGKEDRSQSGVRGGKG